MARGLEARTVGAVGAEGAARRVGALHPVVDAAAALAVVALAVEGKLASVLADVVARRLWRRWRRHRRREVGYAGVAGQIPPARPARAEVRAVESKLIPCFWIQ